MATRRLWLLAMLVLLVSLVLSGAVMWAAWPALAATTGPEAAPTPTLDRLAAPPTVTNPTQANLGAQLYWLHCQPCHGDRAQGLTDEWRAQYPPEDQNCWKSGCHGNRPYQSGFTLPHAVPALIGPSTLNHFATAADLYAFVSRAMPFQAPGSLKSEEYWAITAFILRGHGVAAATLPITDLGMAQRIPLGAAATTAATAAPAGTPASPAGLPVTATLVLLAGLAVTAALAGSVWLWWRRSRGHG